MGKILPGFKKAMINELLDNVLSNTTHYYAFASNPVPFTGNTPAVNNDDYNNYFVNDWNMLFGKKLIHSDFAPAIKKNMWTSGEVYVKYDSTNTAMYSSNTGYYVITPPDLAGGNYNVFKCIDNSNSSVSTVKPSVIQIPTFETSDGYKWRYITSITSSNFIRFQTEDYCPVYTNSTVVAAASSYSGLESIMVANGGSGYHTYDQGVIQGVLSSSIIQIEDDASGNNNFYAKNSIYIYNVANATAQLFDISSYVANSSGKYVYIDGIANLDNITVNSTEYSISPKVVINSDGASNPLAYSTINTTANSIDTIVVINPGTGVTRATVSIQGNTFYGSGANVYAVVPPPGGHGSDPLTELDVQGLAVNFYFANNERLRIPVDVLYNKIGLFKNPYELKTDGTKGNTYTSNTFSQVLEGTLSPATSFPTGVQVTGSNSGALGIVAFCNSSVIYLTGDKHFIDGETISTSNGITANIAVQSIGDVYTKEINPIYVENINNINRSNTQTESFKMVIKF